MAAFIFLQTSRLRRICGRTLAFGPAIGNDSLPMPQEPDAMPMPIDQIRLLEDIGANAWPAAATAWLEGWRLSLDVGVTRRANSVLPNATRPIGDADALIGEVEQRYHAQGLCPCFKLTEAAEPADLDRRLEHRGYRREGHSLVLAADARTIAPPVAREIAVVLDDRPTGAWLDACWPAEPYAAERSARQAIVERVRPPCAFGLARLGTAVGGAALAVADRGWVGLTAVHTLPGQRRRGVAQSLLRALARWATEQGIERLYLQVERDNAPARKLYAGLGFTEAYAYHYRWPACAGPIDRS
jgi:ribosomal protein S18 acetylase RimI-like enzyme